MINLKNGSNSMNKETLTLKKNNTSETIITFVSKYAIIFEILIVVLFFNALTDGLFLSPVNISNCLMQGCTYALLAIGMLFLLVAGHIDLSCGALLGFTGMVAAYIAVRTDLNLSAGAIILIVIGISMLAQLWNGLWITYAHMPAFIATLSSQFIFKGATYMIANGQAIGPMSEAFCIWGQSYLDDLFVSEKTSFSYLTIVVAASLLVALIVFRFMKRNSQIKHGFKPNSIVKEAMTVLVLGATIAFLAYKLGSYKGIPIAVFILFIFTIGFTFMANNTPFGKHIYAVGSNKEAAHMSGVNVKKTTIGMYLVMGFVTGVASIVYLGRVAQATTLAGVNFEFNAITGCIVGGASTMGGIGSVSGAVLGAVFMACLDNGMNLLGVSTNSQYLVKGFVLLFGVAMDMLMKSRKSKM